MLMWQGRSFAMIDLGVFCTMPRLCIGCGLTCNDRPEGTHSNQKAQLRKAAINLLRTILQPDDQDGDNEGQVAYKKVCQQLRQQRDRHFVSMVSSLVLSSLVILISVFLESLEQERHERQLGSFSQPHSHDKGKHCGQSFH